MLFGKFFGIIYAIILLSLIFSCTQKYSESSDQATSEIISSERIDKGNPYTKESEREANQRVINFVNAKFRLEEAKKEFLHKSSFKQYIMYMGMLLYFMNDEELKKIRIVVDDIEIIENLSKVYPFSDNPVNTKKVYLFLVSYFAFKTECIEIDKKSARHQCYEKYTKLFNTKESFVITPVGY